MAGHLSPNGWATWLVQARNRVSIHPTLQVSSPIPKPLARNPNAFNTVPHVLVTSPTIKIISLLTQNCNVAATMNYNVNIYFSQWS